mmetsp:Transcript_9764/g.21113  ORF Transcript_9764/g.21113 Transcript_9764/m.21113 type:complete len:234 (+) Transcript_9764:1139-1840(+)
MLLRSKRILLHSTSQACSLQVHTMSRLLFRGKIQQAASLRASLMLGACLPSLTIFHRPSRAQMISRSFWTHYPPPVFAKMKPPIQSKEKTTALCSQSLKQRAKQAVPLFRREQPPILLLLVILVATWQVAALLSLSSVQPTHRVPIPQPAQPHLPQALQRHRLLVFQLHLQLQAHHPLQMSRQQQIQLQAQQPPPRHHQHQALPKFQLHHPRLLQLLHQMIFQPLNPQPLSNQ